MKKSKGKLQQRQDKAKQNQLENSNFTMDRLGISRWNQLYHQWKSLRGVPFRRKWFVGYDLEGNTYWEFRLASNLPLRRAVEYRNRKQKLCEYTTANVPPRWMQWLRFTRPDRPTLNDLIAEEERIKRLRALAAIADSKWKEESTIEHDKRILNDRIIAARGFVEGDGEQTNTRKISSDDSPIESAHIQPRSKS